MNIRLLAVACVATGALATLACANAAKRDEGTPVSYSALVFQRPKPTLSFHSLADAQTWADTNRPGTQDSAEVFARANGQYVDPGTVVQVVAESANTTSGDGLMNDKKFCEIELPGGNDFVWMQCWYLRPGKSVASRALPPERLPATTGFPSIGDDKNTISSDLASNKSDDPNDTLKDVYYVPIAGQNVRFWFSYFVDGKTQRAGLFTVRVASDTISADAEKEIVSKVLPSDAVEIPTSDAGSAASDDATGLGSSESAVFYESKKLADKVANSGYMQPGGAMAAGSCPLARPGVVEVYRSHDDSGALDELIFTSEYLYHCQRGVVS